MALSTADHIVLTDIYAAGEAPIAGATLDALAAAIRRGVHVPLDVAPTLDDVVAAVVRAARPGDVVLTLGAGSIGSVPERLIEALGAAAHRAEAADTAASRDRGRGGDA